MASCCFRHVYWDWYHCCQPFTFPEARDRLPAAMQTVEHISNINIVVALFEKTYLHRWDGVACMMYTDSRSCVTSFVAQFICNHCYLQWYLTVALDPGLLHARKILGTRLTSRLPIVSVFQCHGFVNTQSLSVRRHNMHMKQTDRYFLLGLLMPAPVNQSGNT